MPSQYHPPPRPNSLGSLSPGPDQLLGCPFLLPLQVLAELPALEVADLSFNIYMEAAASLQPLVGEGGLSRLRRLDLRQDGRAEGLLARLGWGGVEWVWHANWHGGAAVLFVGSASSAW